MIIASIATVPGREKQLRIASGSLYPQCDADMVLIHDKPINGRTDDSRKFNIPTGHEGYVLTCDDDLKYPPNYAEWMTQKLDEMTTKYGPCVISLMGRTVRPPVASYYRDRVNTTKYDWRDSTAREGRVHIGGTGVFCFHTDTIRFDPSDFPLQNAADINVAVKCNALGIPIIRVNPPEPNWIKYLDVGADTIWHKHHMKDERHTYLINKTDWVEI